MTLSQLSLALGAAMVVSHGIALSQPTRVGGWLRQFPRNIPIGIVLMLTGTAWFEWNLHQETLADIGFAVVGVGSCIFVRDYLAVRGLCVVMLMAAWWLCELTRWHTSPWSKALTAWAYVWVLLGLWWSMSPWRMRDAIQWVTRSPFLFRLAAVAGLVWGGIVIVLGLTVLR
jgi:hypothetical protein